MRLTYRRDRRDVSFSHPKTSSLASPKVRRRRWWMSTERRSAWHLPLPLVKRKQIGMLDVVKCSALVWWARIESVFSLSLLLSRESSLCLPLSRNKLSTRRAEMVARSVLFHSLSCFFSIASTSRHEMRERKRFDQRLEPRLPNETSNDVCTGIPLFNRSLLNPNEPEERMMYLIEVRIVYLNNAAFIDSLQLIVRGRMPSERFSRSRQPTIGARIEFSISSFIERQNKAQLNCISYCVSEVILER